jgi:hypothetical protein
MTPSRTTLRACATLSRQEICDGSKTGTGWLDLTTEADLVTAAELAAEADMDALFSFLVLISFLVSFLRPAFRVGVNEWLTIRNRDRRHLS